MVNRSGCVFHNSCMQKVEGPGIQNPGHSQLFNVACRKRKGLVFKIKCTTYSVERRQKQLNCAWVNDLRIPYNAHATPSLESSLCRLFVYIRLSWRTIWVLQVTAHQRCQFVRTPVRAKRRALQDYNLPRSLDLYLVLRASPSPLPDQVSNL